jgi:ankyrin repeat protein
VLYVQVLLEGGATIELQDALGRSALMFAAGNGATAACQVRAAPLFDALLLHGMRFYSWVWALLHSAGSDWLKPATSWHSSPALNVSSENVSSEE